MAELVSIIMPSYNTAPYIADTIRSVQAQTYSEWELLIVDDASTDGTDEAVKPFLADARIRYRKNKHNAGAAHSRNRALRAAKGKWIAFLDSDDLWQPDKLEKQIGFMKRHDCHFSYTDYQEIDAQGNPTGVYVTGPKKITRAGMFRYCWPGCLTVMYDAEAIGRVQIKEIRKNNDYAMWLQVCRKADCLLLPEPLALYRRGRTGSISTHGVRTLIKWHYKLFREAQGQNVLHSLYSTARNMAFGFWKKLRYVKKNRYTPYRSPKVQVLVAAMHQTDRSLLSKLRIHSDVIVGNQCDRDAVERFDYQGHSAVYLHFDERGVGLNRNNALMRATGDFCLFADDDMVYEDDYVQRVTEAFALHPDADVIVFNIKEKIPTRYVIRHEERVGWLNYLRYGAARTAFRLRSVKERGIYFNQCFGGGTEHCHGEDNLFLTACLRNRLKIYAVPQYIASLTEERASTWNTGYDENYIKDQGCLFRAISLRRWRLLCLQDALRRSARDYHMPWRSAYRLMRDAALGRGRED